MKRINILIFSCVLFFITCSNRNDFDNIVAGKFQKCSEKNNNCIIDLSKIMYFEWNTMYYFSIENSREDIEKSLGITYDQWEDVGDRIIFLNNNKIAYQKLWFPNPSEELKGVVFVTNLKSFKVSKSNAKFRITKKENAYYLRKL